MQTPIRYINFIYCIVNNCKTYVFVFVFTIIFSLYNTNNAVLLPSTLRTYFYSLNSLITFQKTLLKNVLL